VLLLHLAASLLQLRGSTASTSPLQDSSGNVLCFNGEIFGGLQGLQEGGNDGKALLAALDALQDDGQLQQQQQQQQEQEQLQQRAHAQQQQQDQQQPTQQQQQQLPVLLSQLRGPWSLIYWQAGSRTLWFGRDWLGEAR
jgi:asparagine synthetase B (glutamine-hydrolysing)